MSEEEMADPQTYRGGAEESSDAKGGAPGASGVPREMVDEKTSDASDPQELKDESMGGWAKEESEHQVPRDGGDNADATSDGGPDPDSPSRTGAGSVADQRGRVGDAETAEGEDANPSGGEGA
jgi:hypothetical protein